jgi:hypothetical protein
MNDFLFPAEFRNLIAQALPQYTSLHGALPQNAHVYLPATHAKALHPNNMLVEGIRGSGKSFWWAVLQDPSYLSTIGQHIGLNRETIVSVGFGETSSPNDYPGKDALAQLLGKDTEPRRIWQTIVFRQIAGEKAPEPFKQISEWQPRIEWVINNPEIVERILYEHDNWLDQHQRHHLILFDALDRTADQWGQSNALMRGLLQVALDFRPYKRLRLKVFARPDQLDDPSIKTFPDSSKIFSPKTSLDWSRSDLYGLLWQHLANDPGSSQTFREGCSSINAANQWTKDEQAWRAPDKLRMDENEQRQVFHAITGPWMGKDKRRGFPYLWLPGHLADTVGKVSPRSFLAAMRHAALDTKARAGQLYAIHYESIKLGVQHASSIRVGELEEDYPWINTLFKPLAGLSVPCQFADIEQAWEAQNALQTLQNQQVSTVRLPPAHLHEGARGVLIDLKGLALIEELKDHRINMPDVYRVGYRIGRKGGVKPIKLDAVA